MPNRKYYPDKTCEQCGAVFNRHRSNKGRLESESDYTIRRFCSSKCSQEWHSGPNHPLYKPEGSIRPDGYVRIVSEGRRIYLHRWLMEQKLGRRLKRDEHVHHIDECPKNNVIENLELITNSDHLKQHYVGWKAKGRINEKGQFV